MALFRRKKQFYADGAEQDLKLCEELDFAATEAYKLLRTNLLFTLQEDMSKPCHVVGVTSSVRGEGKSTTSINLSYALAAMGKKVLLIDGDLRLPTVAKKLNIVSAKGLSDVLLDPTELNHALYVMKNQKNWHILTSGSIPPNPTEMLASSRMSRLVQIFSKNYDFIVLDLPPVNIVSDALVVSPLLDGMLVVVRQNYSNRRELNRCETQLELSGVKILGLVLTDVTSGRSAYRYKYKYRYKHHNYAYDQSGYAKSQKTDP